VSFVEIRQAHFDDLDVIAEIERVCFLPSEAASRESFEKRLQAFPDSFLVAVENGEVVGMI
jgi:ribosomal protein S18 acetylase RimI-like enzyme